MSKNNSNNRGRRLNKKAMTDRIGTFFLKNPDETISFKQLAKALRLRTHPEKRLSVDIVYDMVVDGFLKEVEHGRFRLERREQILTGIFHRKSNGKNFFVETGGTEQIFVAERNSSHAMNNDVVRVSMFARREDHLPEGEVIEILKRAEANFVGTLKVDKYYAFLSTEDRTLANDIFIPKDKLKGGTSGDKAIVNILEWPDEAKNPIGEVVDILGKTGENNAEMHAILAEFGLPYKYPSNVERAADKIRSTITAEDLVGREDFRDTPTFTIDPKDAKDFDDALSIKKLDDNRWEVGVHIADVTHYVKEDTVIDKEAYDRACSVYLVDRTIPMLPEKLCNFLCSLRPDEEKLTFSVIFEMDSDANIRNSHITRAVIKSDRRFAYEDAQMIIEGGDGDYKDEILRLNSLATILRKQRLNNGATDFQRVEMHFEIDENGKPIGVYAKESKEANHLIEEFMLLANKAVAEFVGKVPKGKTAKAFPYRIHDVPTPEKLEDLNWFVNRFGYRIATSGSNRKISKSFNKLLSEVRGSKEQELIETVSLRAMQKARYSTYNIGHYGLAFDYYTHFTSPIRRYPDMMVHRLLARYLEGKRSVQRSKYEDMCEHCSEMEERAANAERASIKYKAVEYMSEHVGEEFDGTISGVTEWGIYVEIDDNHCEGMIPVRFLDDDFYEFDEKAYCLTGRRRHKKYSLGDSMRIKVVKADLDKKQLDFDLVD